MESLLIGMVIGSYTFFCVWMGSHMTMLEPPTCPWCGLTKKVYVRAGSELVCTDCVEVFEASEGSD